MSQSRYYRSFVIHYSLLLYSGQELENHCSQAFIELAPGSHLLRTSALPTSSVTPQTPTFGFQ